MYQGRIGLNGVRRLIGELCPDVRLSVSTFDIDDRDRIGHILDDDADIVAFPLYRSSAFYRRIPLLSQRSKIVHVTDGVGDLFTLWEMQRAVIAKSKTALLKGALVLPQLALCRADLEFNIFYPARSPYAKTSLPVGPFPMVEAKRQRLDSLFKAHRRMALIIDGFDLSAEHIAAHAGINSYVATKRDGGITINGTRYLDDDVICAEEVLEVMRPDIVIGCPSTSLAAARMMHRNLPVYCITTPAALRSRGALFNKVFRTYAEGLGIIFADSEHVGEQFSTFRRLLTTMLRDCA